MPQVSTTWRPVQLPVSPAARSSNTPWSKRLLPLGAFVLGFIAYHALWQPLVSISAGGAPSITSSLAAATSVFRGQQNAPSSAHDEHGMFRCPDYFPAASQNEALSPLAPTVAIVFGTRPEAIKLASVVQALQQTPGARVVTIATGQHSTLLDTALTALGLKPDVVMSLMSPNQELTSLSARLVEHVGCALRQLQPSLLIVQGDTITATAAALAGFMQGIPVGHVEAGLRTYLPKDPFPEEVQRTAITSLASVHFAPTQFAADTLLASGVCASKIVVAGNTVVDALLTVLEAGPSVEGQGLLKQLGMPLPDVKQLRDALLKGVRLRSDLQASSAGTGSSSGSTRGGSSKAASPWVIVTMHRRENFGQPVREVVAAVKQLAVMFPRLRFLLPVHPNPNVRGVISEGLAGIASVSLVEPLPYDQFVFALAGAAAVLTDSGGLQEESVALGRRLFVMRETTERPEALDSGLVTLVGARRSAIVANVGAWAAAAGIPSVGWPPAEEDVPADELVAAQQAEEPHPVSAALAPGTAGVQRPSARLIFGDGRAGARIAGAAARFVAALEDIEAPARPAALRDFQSCHHDARAAARTGALALAGTLQRDAAPLLVDHALHDFTWHDGVGGLQLAGHERHRQRLECSAQPPTHRMVFRRYPEVMALPSSYDHAAAVAIGGSDDGTAAGAGAAAAAGAGAVAAASPTVSPAPATDVDGVLPAKPRGPDPRFAVTAIVSVYKRPQVFQRFLWAMGNQTHPPAEVWVTTFGSKHEDEFRRIIRAHDPGHTVYKFISGDHNFKYFGRFALGMMAKTPYVALFDDDCLPGRRVIETLLHIINVKNGDYNGLLGMKGHYQAVENPGDAQHKLPPYWTAWEYRPDKTVQVDLAGGVWFARTDWLKVMWRETPSRLRPERPTDPHGPWETGEDFHVSYTLRKFLNVNTYLFPTDWNLADTWGASQDYFEISSAGDETVDNSLQLRSNILYANILKGYVPARTDTMWGEAWNVTNVAVLLPSVEQAGALSRIVTFLRAYFHSTIRLWPIVALDPRAPGVSPSADGAEQPTVTRETVLSAVNMDFKFAEQRIGVFDLDLKKLAAGIKWRDTDIQVETEIALAGVLEASRPAALIVPWDDEESPVALAAAMTASSMRIPVLGYAHPALGRKHRASAAAVPEDGNDAQIDGVALASSLKAAPTSHGKGSSSFSSTGDGSTQAAGDCVEVLPPQSLIDAAQPPPEPVFGPLPAGPHALCAPRESLSYTRGPLNFVTNSQVLLLRQLFDTLCACERASSSGIGAFARCPDLGTQLILTEFSGSPVRR